MAVAMGQFTLVDYNDALTLSGYIGSNKPKTQMYNTDNASYNPDWTSSNLVLTPSLFKLGSANDIITTDAGVTSVTWYDVTNGTETAIVTNSSYALGSKASHYTLTIKTNVMAGLPGKDYMCKIIYHDASTGLDLVHKIPISFSRVVNGSGITDAVAWCPDGNVFKNDQTASLKAECDLYRGSVVDLTSVTYKWYKLVAGSWVACAETAGVTTGVTTRQMTVYPSAVSSFSVFKCVITDTDSASNTYNSTFEDSVTFEDKSDPIQVTITSTGGSVFKNGAGSTTLTAKLYQAGAEIDAGATKYTYKWYKLDKDGVIDANFGGAGVNYKTGKTLTVGDADVSVKATFQCEIS